MSSEFDNLADACRQAFELVLHDGVLELFRRESSTERLPPQTHAATPVVAESLPEAGGQALAERYRREISDDVGLMRARRAAESSVSGLEQFMEEFAPNNPRFCFRYLEHVGQLRRTVESLIGNSGSAYDEDLKRTLSHAEYFESVIETWIGELARGKRIKAENAPGQHESPFPPSSAESLISDAGSQMVGDGAFARENAFENREAGERGFPFDLFLPVEMPDRVIETSLAEISSADSSLPESLLWLMANSPVPEFLERAYDRGRSMYGRIGEGSMQGGEDPVEDPMAEEERYMIALQTEEMKEMLPLIEEKSEDLAKYFQEEVVSVCEKAGEEMVILDVEGQDEHIQIQIVLR